MPRGQVTTIDLSLPRAGVRVNGEVKPRFSVLFYCCLPAANHTPRLSMIQGNLFQVEGCFEFYLFLAHSNQSPRAIGTIQPKTIR